MTDTPFGLEPLPGVRTRLPIGTIVVLGVWAVGTTLYHLGVTGLFLAVRRDPWTSVIGLAVLAGVVGVTAERVFGTGRWVVLFLAGAPVIVLACPVVLTVLTDIHGPAILAGAVASVVLVRGRRQVSPV
jgi:hypothetical protein